MHGSVVALPLHPKGPFLSAVAKAKCPTALVLRLVPRHADAHWIERNDAATVVAHFAGEPEALTVSLFSPFAL
jgi:hypothetical protein